MCWHAARVLTGRCQVGVFGMFGRAAIPPGIVRGVHLREALEAELQQRRTMDMELLATSRRPLASRVEARAVQVRCDLPAVSLAFLTPRIDIPEKGVRIDHGVKSVAPIVVAPREPGTRVSRV